MPEIAEAVNRFDSPENQRAALAALVAAIGVSGPIVAETAAQHGGVGGAPLTTPSSIAVTISGGSVGSPTIDAVEPPHVDAAQLPTIPPGAFPDASHPNAAAKTTAPKASGSKRSSAAQ